MERQSMRAIRIHQYGGPEQLILEQVPRPEPQAGEVLVHLHSVGVLPAESKMRQGFFKAMMPITFPYIPGSAISGIVAAVGAGVTAFQPRQAVFGRSNNGAYSEYTSAAVDTLAFKPEALSFDEVATISGGATTAWTALFDNAHLQAGQRVLIHGAAGGVGSFAVQFARWKGAQVIGTASSSNVEFVRALGAQTVIDYTITPFEEAAKDVDLVLDTIGGETTQRSMHVVKPGGTLVSLLGPPPQDKAQQLGIHAMKNEATFPYPPSSLLQTIAQLMAEGQVKAMIGKTFPLQDARLAHELSQSGHGRGRILLYID